MSSLLALALCICAACGGGRGATATGGAATSAATPATGATPATPGTGAAAEGTGGAIPAACDLLTQADAEALAQEVSGSLSSTLDDAVGKDPGQCSYTLGADTPPKTISLILRRAAGVEQAATELAASEAGLQSLSYDARPETVAGLGDAAFWVGGQLDQLHVRRGALLLNFTVQVAKAPLAAAKTLATKALARLAATTPVRSAKGQPHA